MADCPIDREHPSAMTEGMPRVAKATRDALEKTIVRTKRFRCCPRCREKMTIIFLAKPK